MELEVTRLKQQVQKEAAEMEAARVEQESIEREEQRQVLPCTPCCAFVIQIHNLIQKITCN